MQTILADKQEHPKTFNIYQSNGEIKAGLKRSFLLVQDVSAQVLATGKIVLDSDNSVWPLYAEEAVLQAFKMKESVKCIISFQTFTDGQYFAVARLFKSKNKPR